MGRTFLLWLCLLACLRDSTAPGDHAECFHGCHDDLKQCISQELKCHEQEVCLAHIRADGAVFLGCAHLDDHLFELLLDPERVHQCERHLAEAQNHLHFDPRAKDAPPHEHCVYPCFTQEMCVQQLFGLPTTTTTTAPTPSTATTTTTTTAVHWSTDCYSVPCNPRDGNCLENTWICQGFCQIHTHYTSGAIDMVCIEKNIANVESCVVDEHLYNCDGGQVDHDCHFCCPDHHCVSNIASKLASPPATTTQQTAACVDMYAGDCSSHWNIPQDCANQVVRTICPLTCNACHGGTSAATTTVKTSSASTAVQTVQRKCADCVGLSCLTHDPRNTLCAGDQHYCLTAVSDTDHGREITRKCATTNDCNSIVRHPSCLQVENKVLDPQIISKCEYCCDADNCNEPPSLVPKIGLITNHAR